MGFKSGATRLEDGHFVVYASFPLFQMSGLRDDVATLLASTVGY